MAYVVLWRPRLGAPRPDRFCPFPAEPSPYTDVMTIRSLLCILPLGLGGLYAVTASPAQDGPAHQEPVQKEQESAVAEADQVSEAGSENPMLFGPEQAWLSIPERLEVTQDYLEFLLTGPLGGVHESLLSTEIGAQVLNTGFLAMGLQPGKNARWESLTEDPLDPSSVGVQGQRAKDAPGVDPAGYKVHVPEGDGLFLYVAWREGEETFFFRLEDLIRDLDRGRTLRRHQFVYLGSFMSTNLRTGEPQFAASLEGNLINAAFFRKGATLFTTAVEECDKQSNWLANSWLLPSRGSNLLLLFSKETLSSVPKELLAKLPALPAQNAERSEDEWR